MGEKATLTFNVINECISTLFLLPFFWKQNAKVCSIFCRRGIALASLGGPIYAIGGLDDNTCFNDVERYDIESDQWSTVAPMNTPRGGVGSVALVVGYITAQSLDCIALHPQPSKEGSGTFISPVCRLHPRLFHEILLSCTFWSTFRTAHKSFQNLITCFYIFCLCLEPCLCSRWQ